MYISLHLYYRLADYMGLHAVLDLREAELSYNIKREVELSDNIKIFFNIIIY